MQRFIPLAAIDPSTSKGGSKVTAGFWRLDPAASRKPSSSCQRESPLTGFREIRLSVKTPPTIKETLPVLPLNITFAFFANKCYKLIYECD